MTAAGAIETLQSAAKKYYVTNSAWPTNITTLKATGYLPTSFSEIAPWGGVYSVVVNSADPQKFDISLSLPSSAAAKLTTASLDKPKNLQQYGSQD